MSIERDVFALDAVDEVVQCNDSAIDRCDRPIGERTGTKSGQRY